MSKPAAVDETKPQPFPAWLRTLYFVIAASVTSTVAVVGAYASVKSDVRDNATVTAEHGRRIERLEAAVEKIVPELADIKADTRYLRTRTDHP